MTKKNKIIIFIIFMLVVYFLTYSLFDNKSVKASPMKKEKSSDTIFIDIKGAVKKPGVYEIKNNSRIIDAITKAGDLKKDADTSIINLSKKLKDEMVIIIYTKDEVELYKEKYNSSSEVESSLNEKIICPDSNNDGCMNSDNKTNIVNINTASINELTSLPGIGESKAKKIIEYRNKQKFESKEDIMNVSGIGESQYEKIKDYIKV